MGVGKRIDRSVVYGSMTATGKTLRERVWEELDDAMDHLMDDGKPESWTDDRDPDPRNPEPVGTAEEWRNYGYYQGVASAIAVVLAMFENPIYTDVDEIRGAAVIRYKERKAAAELTQKTAEEVVEDGEAQEEDEQDGQDAV